MSDGRPTKVRHVMLELDEQDHADLMKAVEESERLGPDRQYHGAGNPIGRNVATMARDWLEACCERGKATT